MSARGFTLVELVMVIVITGILAATITIFMKPAIDSYFDTRRRADLTDMADTALRRMAKDIRSAVPNSVRSVTSSCFQLVPTIAGGRYRMAPDTVWDAANSLNPSAFVDTSAPTSSFDVLSPLSPLSPTPTNDDWVVIDNQNTDDVYNGTNRAALTLGASPHASVGTARISFATAKQFPVGYDGGRFVVVPNAEQTVFYNCNNRTLYRGFTNTFVQLADQAACNAAGGAIVATDVESCTFVYNPNKGATQQSGFVWMRLELKQSGESIALAHGVHVDNVP